MTSRRRVLLLVAAVVLLGPAALGTAPLAAQAPSADGSTVDLVSQTTWIAPDGDVRLRLDVSGAQPDDRLTVTFHGRLPGRFALADSLAGDDLGRAQRTLADATVAELDPDGDGRIDATLGLRSGAGDAQRLLVTREGLHPVQVVLAAADGTEHERFVTHVARLPPTDTIEQTLGVAVVQPLDAAPSLRPDGTWTVPDDARARLTRATGAFGTEAAVPVTFRTTPETLAALAASGNPLDGELLTGLGETVASGSIAASPFVRIDPDALVDAGLDDVVPDQLARGASALDAHLGVAPDATTWIADGTLGPDGLGALLDAGVEHLVVPQGSLVGERPDLLVQPFGLGTGDGREVRALTTDPRLQSHLGSTGSPVRDAQNVLTELASIWFERPAYARSTVLVLPSGVPDRLTVETLLEGLAGSPLLSPGDVPTVMDAAAPAAVGGIDETVVDPEDRLVLALAPVEPEGGFEGYRALLERTLADVASFESIFGAPPPTVDYAGRIATSVAADLSASERRDFLVAIRDDVELRTSNLGMPDRGAVTLPSRDGILPLTLVNNTGSPARVVIRFSSDKLEFPDGERLEFTLTEPTTAVEIPVRVRSSGAFPLDMTLESPDGQLLLVDSRYTVRSTAVSGLGIALSGTAVLVLGAWWIRTARRARAAHADSQ